MKTKNIYKMEISKESSEGGTIVFCKCTTTDDESFSMTVGKNILYIGASEDYEFPYDIKDIAFLGTEAFIEILTNQIYTTLRKKDYAILPKFIYTEIPAFVLAVYDAMMEQFTCEDYYFFWYKKSGGVYTPPLNINLVFIFLIIFILDYF